MLRMFLVLFDERSDVSGNMGLQTLVDLFDVLFIQMCCKDAAERTKWRGFVKKNFYNKWSKGRIAVTRDPTEKKAALEDQDEVEEFL